jgi:hypothetical protein
MAALRMRGDKAALSSGCKPATRDVRLTSIRDVAQTSQMRKERPFPEGTLNGSHRPEGPVPEFGPCTGGVRQKAPVGANGKMRGAERGDPLGVSSRIGLRHAHVKRDPP